MMMNLVDGRLYLDSLKLVGFRSLIRFCFVRVDNRYVFDLPGLGSDYELVSYTIIDSVDNGGSCNNNFVGMMMWLELIFFSKSRYNYLSKFLRICASGLVLNQGYFAELVTRGIGYRFRRVLSSNGVLLIIGRSHRIVFFFPYDVLVAVKKYRLFLFSLNKGSLSYYSKLVKSFRFPDVYKGKGLKFSGEVLVLKEGKKKK